MKFKIEADVLSVHDAIQVLEEYGSSEDPIIYEGTETTPAGLATEWGLDNEKVKNVRFKFYKISGTKNEHVEGNLHDMIEDRLLEKQGAKKRSRPSRAAGANRATALDAYVKAKAMAIEADTANFVEKVNKLDEDVNAAFMKQAVKKLAPFIDAENIVAVYDYHTTARHRLIDGRFAYGNHFINKEPSRVRIQVFDGADKRTMDVETKLSLPPSTVKSLNARYRQLDSASALHRRYPKPRKATAAIRRDVVQKILEDNPKLAEKIAQLIDAHVPKTKPRPKRRRAS